MSTMDVTADVAVLGGGPGGYVAALSAARRGAHVVLVEKDRLGGTCLNVGCIPTKALATSAELLMRVQRADEFGLAISEVGVDLPRLMSYKQTVVDQLVGGVEQLLRARRVKIVRGQGRLARPDRLSVDLAAGGVEEVTARQVILATGSVTAEPPIEGRDLPGVATSTDVLNIQTIPSRFVVIGGGVIGLEFACIYEALGSKVTVLEMAPSLLPNGVDEAIAKRLQILLRRRGMQVHTGVTVERIEQTGDALRVVTAGTGPDTTFAAERVLVATGRWPNTQGQGLAEAGLHMNGRAIAVDDLLTDKPAPRLGDRRRGRWLDAGTQGDGGRPSGCGKRDRRKSADRLPLGAECHFYQAGDRRSGPD